MNVQAMINQNNPLIEKMTAYQTAQALAWHNKSLSEFQADSTI
jgi:hypothetical protein